MSADMSVVGRLGNQQLSCQGAVRCCVSDMFPCGVWASPREQFRRAILCTTSYPSSRLVEHLLFPAVPRRVPCVVTTPVRLWASLLTDRALSGRSARWRFWSCSHSRARTTGCPGTRSGLCCTSPANGAPGTVYSI